MLIRTCKLIAVLLLGALPLLAQEQPTTLAPKLLWEAEDLAATAKIVGGGDLLIIRAPDPAKLPFSSERALTFVPMGKNSTLQLTIPVPKPGVYQVRLKGVMGPSGGIYNMYVAGEEKGYYNMYAKATVHTNLTKDSWYGLMSKKIAVDGDRVRLDFQYYGAQGRMGDLVIDTLELMPFVRKPIKLQYTPYDVELPAGEKLGDNLMKNPGFEEFQPQDKFTARYQNIRGWVFNTVIPQKLPPIVRDPAQARNGNIALRLAPDMLEDNTIIYQSLPFNSGKTYRITFWARGTGNIEVNYYYPSREAKAEDTLRPYNAFESKTDWTRYSFLFAPSKSGKLSSAAIAIDVTAESVVYFDDFTVQEVLP